VICWNDFILDDVLGPVLNVGDETSYASCRVGARIGRPSARNGTEVVNQIQETRQEQRPARMVGLSELDSNRHEDMEVDRCDQAPQTRPREEV
jgi:hypothetical protein